MNTREAMPVNRQRRALLIASLAGGGGMLISGLPTAAAAAAAAAATGNAGGWQPNAYLRIDPSGTIVVFAPYAEMGQGAYTSQAMVVAEELDVPLSAVVVEAAPADDVVYASPLLGGQITGGSASLRAQWATMRTAGAAARAMLVQAAAHEWGVAPGECTTADGVVAHKASGRSLPYGQLVRTAATLPVPKEPQLKKPDTFNIVGKTFPRVDLLPKCNGSAVFGMDMQLPGMRYAVVSASPVFGGKLRSVDAAQAMKVRGVSQIVRLPDAVAVVANSTWAAMKGQQALKIDWDEGANARVSTADLVARADAAFRQPGLLHLHQGDVPAAERSSASRYEAVFRLPALAHAAIEPLNATVHVRDGQCDVWCGTQVIGRAGKAAAEAAGLPLQKIRIHNCYLGGGFGRRLETDYVSQAVTIARQIRGPVKVVWSRAEDLQHDYYRGVNHSRVSVSLDGAGKPLSWRHRLVGPAIMARFLPAYSKENVDGDIVENAVGHYDIPNVWIDFTRHEAPEGMNTGNWRGVGPTRNVFVVESVMDDLAFRAKADPLAYRRALMTQAPARLRHVLDVAAEKAGWGTPLPQRSGRGISVFEGFACFMAIVAQVHVDASGRIAVERMTCALDTGMPVAPDVVLAQVEGGIMFGVSAALHERVIVADGRVQQANYDTYPILRMAEAPRIDVYIVQSTEPPGGIGEPGTTGAIAAVANAVFAATGVRSYSLPLDPSLFKVAT
jgi:isoquinoline 1-oxidoreductase beta subunit